MFIWKSSFSFFVNACIFSQLLIPYNSLFMTKRIFCFTVLISAADAKRKHALCLKRSSTSVLLSANVWLICSFTPIPIADYPFTNKDFVFWHWIIGWFISLVLESTSHHSSSGSFQPQFLCWQTICMERFKFSVCIYLTVWRRDLHLISRQCCHSHC